MNNNSIIMKLPTLSYAQLPGGSGTELDASSPQGTLTDRLKEEGRLDWPRPVEGSQASWRDEEKTNDRRRKEEVPKDRLEEFREAGAFLRQISDQFSKTNKLKARAPTTGGRRLAGSMCVCLCLLMVEESVKVLLYNNK